MQGVCWEILEFSKGGARKEVPSRVQVQSPVMMSRSRKFVPKLKMSNYSRRIQFLTSSSKRQDLIEGTALDTGH